MRKAMLSILLIISAIFTLSISPATGSEYFPLKEGLQWKIRYEEKQGKSQMLAYLLLTVQSQRVISGQRLNVIQGDLSGVEPKFKGFTSFIFLDENAQGIRTVAVQGPDDQEPKAMANYWEVKFPLAVGTSWTNEEEIGAFGDKFTVPAVYSIEQMDDVVTVPAGTFENCMKIHISYSGKVNLGSYGGNPEVVMNGYAWYAPGVGQIKSWRWRTMNKPGMEPVESTLELTSFKK